MRYGQLLEAIIGDVVTFPKMINMRCFRVIKVRDRRIDGILTDTLRRRPLNIRSRVYVTLRDMKTGRLQTRYFAENMPAFIVTQEA